jgi:L-rhamnose isomerase/sugar isomerase
MSESPRIDPRLVERNNGALRPHLDEDYAHLARQLARRGIEMEALTERARTLRIALPSWGVGTGGTRFARFPGPGEPRTVEEKLQDCATVQELVRITPKVSLHIPWDRPKDPRALRDLATSLGLGFDAMNSNTFQDQPGQELSYKYGSLSHTDHAVRRQAIDHNRECIEIGKALGSKALTVWIADGGNFPGQQDLNRALDRYLESLQAIALALPPDWKMYLEHKLYEPAFYSTVNNDWGTSFWCASQIGPQASCLVDLGHHAPNVNIEMIVARLLRLGKLGGFHFNDSKNGDDDLDAGSIKPFQLFLIFHELVQAEIAHGPHFQPAYMLDQSHNVTDPLESLMMSAAEVQRAYVKAWLVDRAALARYQERNDVLMAHAALKQAFHTDVEPILAMARLRSGGAIDPVGAYRQSRYRERVARERPASPTHRSGIV